PSKKELDFVSKIIDNSPFPTILHAEDGSIVHMNQAWYQMSGYCLDEFTTIDAWTKRAYNGQQNLIVRDHIKTLYQLDRLTAEGEFEIQTANGERRIWSFYSAPVGKSENGMQLVLSTAADVTEQKAVEKA